MMTFFLSALIAPVALQAAPAPAAPAPTDLSQFPIEEATAARCGVAFAIIEGAQEAGDARAKEWPDIKARGGQEFFVVALARLMESRQLDREAVLALTQREVARLSEDDFARAHELMPPCLLLLDSSGA